jgi:methylenetetrahydrofolate dehydrogenase (NADP+)/methenyltetrahydrofolate cyclohydrolase
MSAVIIDGLGLAEREKESIRGRVKRLAESGRRPALTAVLVGSTAAGELYAQRQGHACENVGITYQLRKLPGDTTPGAAAEVLESLTADAGVTGIMLHLPLPGQLDATELQYKMLRV